MKKLSFFVAMAFGCALQLWAQEPSVSIRLNEEERFKFEESRISFTNPLNNIFIGDSAGSFGSEARDNISIGKFAGSHPGKSYDNIFIGRFAGMSDTSGYNNVYIGFRCGLMSRSGVNNIFLGYESGHNNIEGSYNTFIGSLSGRNNTSGALNTFIGRRAGNENTTGSENTLIGQGAGFNNYDGKCNTFVGRFAGGYNNGGDSNVFIGYTAGMYDTTSNTLIIANSETFDPLIFGSFNEKMLRFNAGRMEIRNPLENTIIGDSAALDASGYKNVILGNKAGKFLKGGYCNTYLGYQAGYADTSGRWNVYIGMQTGWQNTSGHRNTFVGFNAGYSNTTGFRNTFIGLSTGRSNTTGSYNTYLGRCAGWFNETGDSNVFIGNAAGWNEMGSNKLYITNSESADPLIYGDFAEKNVIFNANWIEVRDGAILASHEIITDWRFVAAGNPGITDTVNTITSYDFEQQKLKYRTTVYTGGIVTFLSLESGWVDAVDEYLTPCGEIGMVGEFNVWTDDMPMRRNAYNPDLWSVTLKLTIDDDLSEPVDSIVETKFREDASWAMSWGSEDFPTGIGTNQYGLNIPVTLDDVYDTTIYFVAFNCRTGEYNFEDLTGFCGDSITDARDGKKYATVLIGNQCWMAQDLNVGLRIDASGDQADNSIIEKYCYEDLESNCDLWGGLYQWPELMQYVTTPGVQGICPAGWRVPTDEEFKVLEGNVDSQYGPGSKEWNKSGGWRGLDAGYNLRASSGWSGNGNGSDTFGFHALPGGYMVIYNVFNDGGGCLNYQTSSSDGYGNPFVRHINGDFSQILRNVNGANAGCSLRCIKDK